MIKSGYKSPSSGPLEGLQVQKRDIIQYIVVVPRDSSNYKQFVVMQNSCMSCTSFRNWTCYCRLGPMRSRDVENNEIGEVGSMFVLAAEDEKFVSLVERSSVT